MCDMSCFIFERIRFFTDIGILPSDLLLYCFHASVAPFRKILAAPLINITDVRDQEWFLYLIFEVIFAIAF